MMSLRDAALIAIVLLCTHATITWLPDTAVTRHHDEQVWIASGHDAWQLLANGDFREQEWDNPRWGPFGGRTPVLAKLVIGASVASAGLGDEARRLLPDGAFDWVKVEKIEPSPQLLAAGRRPMPWVAALSAIALYVLLRRLAFPTAVAALTCGLLVLRPLMLESGRLAMIDMPTLAATLVACAAAAIVCSRRGGWWQWLLVGLVGGLAIACKLTGLLAMFVAAAWCAMQGFAAHGEPSAPATTRAWKTLANGACLGFGAAVSFVVIQPLLWHDPLGHTWRMFGLARRVAEYDAAPEERLGTFGERCLSLLRFGLDVSDPAAVWFGLPFVGAALAVVGLIVLLRRVFSRGTAATPARLAAVWIVTVAALTVVSVPFAWRRWYLPMEPCWAFLQASGVCALVASVRSLRQRRRDGLPTSGS